VQRVVGAQRRNPVLGRVVAAPGGDDVAAVKNKAKKRRTR